MNELFDDASPLDAATVLSLGGKPRGGDYKKDYYFDTLYGDSLLVRVEESVYIWIGKYENDYFHPYTTLLYRPMTKGEFYRFYSGLFK